MSTATVDQLGGLHLLLCTVMTERLNEIETIEAMTVNGPVTVGQRRAATSKDFAEVAKFLKDNSISANMANNGALESLGDALASRARYSENVVALPNPLDAVNAG